MTLLRKISKPVVGEYSSEGVITTAIGGAFIAVGVFSMIQDALKKRRDAEEADISKPLKEIRTLIEQKILSDAWISKQTPAEGPISADRIADRIYRPHTADSKILNCFEEGVANLDSLLKVIEAHLEPQAKLIKEEDTRLCALAKNLDPNNEKDSEKVEAEIAKANKKLAHVKPPFKQLGAAAKWYLSGYEVVVDSDSMTCFHRKPTSFPKTIDPLKPEEVKKAGQLLLKALNIVDRYQKLVSSKTYNSYHDDGENLRHFYDSVSNMDTYYDLTEGDVWDIGYRNPFEGIVGACQGMMHYIEKSFK